MSTPPPPFDPSDDADEQYRRASELDPSRPSEATRRAVLDHAARLAAERLRRGRPRWWLPLAGTTLRWQAIVGTAAAAALAGVMIAPQFLAPTVPPESRSAAAGAPAAQEMLQQPAPPRASSRSPVESVPPLNRAVNAPGRAGIPPTRAPAASDAVTTRQLEERAEAKAERAPVLAPAPAGQLTAVTGSGPAVAPTASASRAAPVARPPSSPPQGSASPVALRQAAAAGDLVALKRALAGDSDIEARDAQGRTALMVATLNGQADAVAVLLAHGADPSAPDAQGTTPLQAAVAADEREIIALLRRYGAR